MPEEKKQAVDTGNYTMFEDPKNNENLKPIKRQEVKSGIFEV